MSLSSPLYPELQVSNPLSKYHLLLTDTQQVITSTKLHFITD